MRKFSYVFNVERWLTRVLSEAELSPLVNYSQRKLYFQKKICIPIHQWTWTAASGKCFLGDAGVGKARLVLLPASTEEGAYWWASEN